MHPILKGALARGASLVPSAVATLLASRLIISHYDIRVFNTYILVFTTMVLIPLNDLGAGAAVTSAVATDGPDEPHTAQVALTAARTLAVSGLALALVALSLSALGLWGNVLGGGAYATGTFGVAIAAYGLSFVPGIGQSILLGANKNHFTIVVQAFLAPGMCAGAAIAILLDADPRIVIAIPGITVLVISLVNAWVSARATGLHLLPLVPKLPFRKRHPGAKIRGIAGPALIVSLTAPITLQSDRFVLSHFSTTQALANYSVAIQIFTPLFALIPAAALPLWPMYTKARATGTRPVSMTKVLTLFVGLAGSGAGALCVVAGRVAHLIGGHQIDLGIALTLATAAAVVVQAVAVPLSMALMYPAGLRLIASLSLVAVPVNIGLSILVAPHLGAPGPLYVGIGIGFFVQTIPGLVFYRRHPIGVGATQGEGLLPVEADGSSGTEVGLPEHDAPATAPDPASPRRDLSSVVTAAIDRAVSGAVVALDLGATTLSAGTESHRLDRLGDAVARIEGRTAQLEAVALQLDALGAALDRLDDMSGQLIDLQGDTAPSKEVWRRRQRGQNAVRRSLDGLVAEVQPWTKR